MSSKIKLVYIVLFLILLVISMKSAFALQEDFNAYASQKTLYACSCSDLENSITIENTGDVTSVYEISQSGSALPYSAFSPSRLTLKPGESRRIPNFISAECGTEGNFALITSITTEFGLSKQMEQAVDVRKCINTDVIQTEQPSDVCPCKPVRYTFVVKNTGDFVETYNLNVTPYAEYISISEEVLVLGPGKSEEIYVFVATPCGIYGELDFVLRVEAQTNEMIAELPFSLNINPCYDYSISSADSYSVCKDIRNSVPVTITNNADVANSYFLNTNSQWAFFDSGVVSLAKKQATNVNVTVYPSAVPEGLYNITFNAVSERGQLPVDKSVSVSVENCYSIHLTTDPAPQLVSCEQYIANGHASNDGTRASRYSFSLFGEEWASLGKQEAVVNPGTTEDVPVMLNVPCNVTGEHEFVLRANVTNFPEKVVQDSFLVGVTSIEDAYKIEVNSIEDDLEVDYAGGTHEITLTNLGIRNSTYDILFQGNHSWIGLDRTRIMIPAGGTESVNMISTPTNETPEGTYDISLTAIPLGKEIGYEREFSLKLREKTLWEKFVDSWPYLLAGVLLLVLLTLALLLLNKRRSKEDEKFWQEVEGEPSRIIPEEKEDKLLEVDNKERKWLKWLIIIGLLLLILGALGAGVYFLTSYLASDSTNMTDQASNQTGMPYQDSEWNQTQEMNQTQEPGLLSSVWNWIFGDEETEQEDSAEDSAESKDDSQGLLESATIYVNRTGLEGEGDIIEIKDTENITIPLTIQNNYEPNTFRIRVNEDVDWISVDQENIEIAPDDKGTVNIIVTPDENVEQGNYRINIKIDVEGKQKPISEEIVLKVSKDEPFYIKYLWYLIAALIVLAVLAGIAGAGEWKQRRDAAALEPVAEEKKKPKEKKRAMKEEEETEGRPWLKYAILGIIIILVLAGIVYAGLYAFSSVGSLYGEKGSGNETANQTGVQTDDAESNVSDETGDIEEQMAEEIEDFQEPEIEAEEPEIKYEDVFVQKGVETVIPLKIRNANETATFKIKVNEDIEWITVDSNEVQISPNENATVNLLASPDSDVEDGDYMVSVNVEVSGEEKQFTQGFILNVGKSRFSAFWSYLLYALAGIILLAIAIGVLNRMEKGKEPEEEKEKETKDKKQAKGKKKTGIKLK
ncbi:hypothetical protein GF345_02675 [Candidatus Woesearchaeota archaeon]|nr:hypothetical protein [Candidatus Woesearchaeota archaeon]